MATILEYYYLSMENAGASIEGKIKLPSHLTLQEGALGSGMLYRAEDATTSYEQRGKLRIHTASFTPNEYEALVREFRHDPFPRLAFARENLLSIMKDQRLTPEKRRERLERYIDAFISLNIKLDKDAFPPSDHVYRGVPRYVPDGLSDMGSDPNPDQTGRSREKIRINKAEILEKAKPLIFEVLSKELPSSVTSEQRKKWITESVAHFVYNSMPYNHDNGKLHSMYGSDSVVLTDIAHEKLAVCRHHALMTQVLLQSFGISSRLIKSELVINGNNLGPHANNIVRMDGNWYIIDTTNPERNSDRKSSKVFIRRLPEKQIDTNMNNYEWDFDLSDGEKRGYITHSNMFYRIRDNRKDPPSK